MNYFISLEVVIVAIVYIEENLNFEQRIFVTKQIKYQNRQIFLRKTTLQSFLLLGLADK